MNELIWQAQSGNKDAMSKLLDENIRLVWSIVKRFNNRGYELEDLFQLGCIGFVKAVQRFNTDYETQLSTYAVPMIIGEIKRFLRDNGPMKVSRSLKELATKVRQLQDENTMSFGQELSINEIATKLKVSKEDIVASLDATSYIESLDKQAFEDDDTTLGERIICEEKEYNDLLNKLTIESMLNKLTVKEKRIIIYRFYKEKTQTEISKMLGISQVQVSRIEKKALDKMRA